MEEILQMEEIFMDKANRTIHSELKLVVSVGSFFSLPDGGPKTYVQGKTVPTQHVAMHNFHLLELVNFIFEHFMWGSKQYMTLWRSLDGDSIEIKSDEEMLDWFQLNLEKRVVCIDAKIIDFDSPLQFSPTKCRCHLSVRNRAATNERATMR
uniref:PB1 domain-containing protein n=1 Tax=Oryza nivara TaxID=4536 RepID=A0A0E0J035_ORYNI